MSEKANEITIRNVTEEDAAELLGIYAYYVKNRGFGHDCG